MTTRQAPTPSRARPPPGWGSAWSRWPGTGRTTPGTSGGPGGASTSGCWRAGPAGVAAELRGRRVRLDVVGVASSGSDTAERVTRCNRRGCPVRERAVVLADGSSYRALVLAPARPLSVSVHGPGGQPYGHEGEERTTPPAGSLAT